jgi:phosphate transport system substrate-binding protein
MTRTLFVLALVGCGAPSGGGTVVVQDKGSDTMVNLMQRMSEAYTKVNPKIVVAVTGGGSGTGIKSMIDGTTDLANASREMKPAEIEMARKNGHDPVRTIVAYDGLAVYVNKDNPIERISFEDLRCIYSAEGACNKWSDLGVTFDCGGTDTIIKLGRQNNSGTYEYFKEEILHEGARFTNTMDQSGTQQVVDVVGTSKCAIGYGGMGYHTDRSRFVCLSKEKDTECATPTLESVKAGKYQFARPLQVYTSGPPAGATKEFLDFILSDVGQELVKESGFVPVVGMN